MKRSHDSLTRNWIYSGIICSCVAVPLWSQDTLLPDPILDSFTPLPQQSSPYDDFAPLPPPYQSEEEVPAATSDPETNHSELDADLANAETAPRSASLRESNIERQRSFLKASSNAQDTLKTGRDAFERGLMPLEDYADIAQSTLDIRLTIASLQNDRGARVAALSAHSGLMRSAAKQLRDLNQPAAAGWAADTAYAELLSANADLRLAAARGDRDSYEAAVDRSQKLADTHYTLRSDDFDQGLASLPSLARAASYLTTEIGLPAGNRANQQNEPGKFTEYVNKLEDIVEQTQKFAELEAGVGREDRLFQAQFELNKMTGQLALQQKDKQAAIEAFDRAIDASQQWFESQTKFYETGTASLRDVTQAWWNRVELADLAERAGLKLDKQTAAQTDTQLAGLKRLVAGAEDRQGRIAADVAHIKSLESLQGLWTRQRVAMTLAGKAPGKKPIVKSARVLDLNKDAQTKPASDTVPGTTPTTSERTAQSTIEIIRPQRKPKQ